MEKARRVYAMAAYNLLTDQCSLWWHRCPACVADNQAVDAASIALDMVTAEWFAGRRPSFAVRAEMP